VHFSSGGVKLLALAEALLKKHINSHSLHEPEGISVFFNALCNISYPFVFSYTDVVLS
jgi:N-terminal acetyltransferase B complex non-catalytic subunit